MKKIVILFLTVLMSFNIFAQDEQDEQVIMPAVPFLTIVPDSRSAGMGDIGVATSPDLTSIFHNSAKFSFIEQNSGIQLSYSPWLHNLTTGMSINYLSGFFKINDKQAFAASLKYFAIGSITFTDETGAKIVDVKPNEFALTGAYSMKLSENFSGSIALRFIYSNLTGGGDDIMHPGIAVAGDMAYYYHKPLTIGGKDAVVTWGLNLSNIGSKISYGTTFRSFIPTNFRTGGGFEMKFDDYNRLFFGLDMNKLMIPTTVYDEDGNYLDIGVAEGIIRSFYDAPGGLTEEFHEIMWGTGLEYTYNNTFFVRGGFFYENPNKGGRKYITTGLGFKLTVMQIDFSYLIPVYTHSALEGTMRFTMSFYFNKNKTQPTNE